MVRPLLLDGARLVVTHQGVLAETASAPVIDAETGPWRQSGARAEGTSDQVCASWCVGSATVELGLQDGESYDWRYWQLSAEHHHPSGLMPWQ